MITTKTLRSMTDCKRSETLGRGAGTLLFWKRSGRIRLFFRYTKPDGKQDDLPIGRYDEDGTLGLTLAQARAQARTLSSRYQAGARDLRGALVVPPAEETATPISPEAQPAPASETLEALCNAYVAQLAARGKPSAKEAASAFRVHVINAHPELAQMPANAIQSDQLVELLRAVRAQGKHRMAGIVRAYLSAAYQQAIEARFDTGASAALHGEGITQNPVAPIKAIRVNVGQRTLSHAELRAYLAHLGDDLVDQGLALALLAGGQRIAQLLRARVGDWEAEARVLRLWDGKGQRDTPREHRLPLADQAAERVDRLVARARTRAPDASNPSLWCSVGGACLVASTLSQRVAVITRTMDGEPFNLRDLRRTVETQLAGLGISRDVRAQLLSHGLSGVQARHYDRHGYMEEKRAALQAWEQHLGSIIPTTKDRHHASNEEQKT